MCLTDFFSPLIETAFKLWSRVLKIRKMKETESTLREKFIFLQIEISYLYV